MAEDGLDQTRLAMAASVLLTCPEKMPLSRIRQQINVILGSENGGDS
jgi:hypothetical protein